MISKRILSSKILRYIKKQFKFWTLQIPIFYGPVIIWNKFIVQMEWWQIALWLGGSIFVFNWWQSATFRELISRKKIKEWLEL